MARVGLGSAWLRAQAWLGSAQKPKTLASAPYTSAQIPPGPGTSAATGYRSTTGGYPFRAKRMGGPRRFLHLDLNASGLRPWRISQPHLP